MSRLSAGRVRDYKDLTVWQKSMRLSREVYRIMPRMPADERFALTDQMRRCVTSIPLNIAEGYGLETQLLLVRELELVERSALEAALGLVAEVRRMLHALVCSREK